MAVQLDRGAGAFVNRAAVPRGALTVGRVDG